MAGEWYHPGRGVFRDPGWGSGRRALFQHRADELREAVPGPVETALHGAEVASCDLGDFLIALPFQLTEHEHLTVVLGKLVHATIYRVLQEALAIQVVGTGRRVLDLERPVIGVPVPLARL